MKRLRIMNWNILYTENPENIYSLVKKINPDIFCCQEINETLKTRNGQDLLTLLSTIFPYSFAKSAVIIGSRNEKLDLGNGVFSKFEIKSSRELVLREGENKLTESKEEKRIYVEADLEVNGEIISVGTTHLTFNPYFKDTADKATQIDKIIAAVKSKKKYVITGDLNSAPDSKTIGKLEKFLVSAGPPHDQPTFTTIPFSLLGFEVKDLEWRIDYVFATPDIKVLSSRIIKTNFSDHLPIVAGIEV